MRRILLIIVITIFLGSVVIVLQGKRVEPVSSIDTTLFASEGIWLQSPSGKFGLSVEECLDDDVSSLRIIVCAYDSNYMITSEDLFRRRDTLLVLWDDMSDRVWAYSGDLGTFYWDIVDYELKKNSYSADSGASVPSALRTAKPKIYSN